MNTLSAHIRRLLILASIACPSAVLAEEDTTTSSQDTDTEASAPGSSGDATKDSDAVRFSGFARLVGGYLDESDASYLGYDDSISFGEHSLLALQTDIDLSEQFSFTTQLLAHSSDTRESGVEWAYLTYRPNERWQFKAGKLRTPFFFYSDVIDVGFAYPWVTPPQQVYNPYVFSNFTGASAAYQFNISDWRAEVEAYWGNFDDDIFVADNRVQTEVNDLRGILFELSRGNLKLRASRHNGDVDIEVPELQGFAEQLFGLGFERSADSLIPNGDVAATQLALSYDALDYFVKSEWTRFSTDTFSIPDLESYYLSGGYVFYPFTVHATFSDLSTEQLRPVQEIPLGVSPELDALGFAYSEVFTSVRNDNLQSFSVGIRWDWSPSVALKAEWIHLEGDRDQRSFFSFDPTADFDRRANLYLFAVDWIF